MRRPTLIVIQGVPGAGKTTLVRRLSADLGLPSLGKDDLKEFLFDRVGTGDREWSRMLGKAVSEMLYPLVDSMLANGHDFIVESAFYREFAAPELEAIVSKYDVRCLEIYCHLDPIERARRFIDRNESGERHPGHNDAATYDKLHANVDQDKAVYGPLGVGALLSVDTTHFGDPEYEMLRRRIETFLNE